MDIQTKMFEILDTVNNINNLESPYTFEGNPVPRVTSILSDMLHEDYLMTWANNVGLYQRKKHTEYNEKACAIGELAHKGFEIAVKEMITDVRFFPFDRLNIPQELYVSVHNAIASFMQWWKNIVDNHKVEVIMQEVPLICKWYGGTVDCVLKIDGLVYIIDFKTSNYPSYKYHLQLAAYIMILENVYNLSVDGSIILLLSKHQIGFTEQYMNFRHNSDHFNYLNYLKNTFLSLVYAYYNRKHIETMYNQYIKNMEDVINEKSKESIQFGTN